MNSFVNHSTCAVPVMQSDAAAGRRKFLRGLAGSAAGAVLGGMLPSAAAFESVDSPARFRSIAPTFTQAQASVFASEAPFFREFSRQFTLDPDVLYLMAGQKGSMAAPVLAHLKEGLDRIARDPFPVFVEKPQQSRERIAAAYGASADEIAIACNTTDALAQILMGIDWKAGDEILVSPLEHPASIAPTLRLAARYGVMIRQFGIPSHWNAGSDEVVDAVKRQMRAGRTKVLLFSSPLWPTGMRMPERKLARLAQEHGVVTVVDGAHYGGMFDPELDDSGIDFWAIAGHKWQCGPGGTGILYARNKLTATNAGPLPKLHLIRSAMTAGVPADGERPVGFDIGSALSSYGSPESGSWRALADACALWDQVGRKRIERWILTLADYMRDRIASTFGQEAILQPGVDRSLTSGIVAFNPFPDARRRRDQKTNELFRERLLREYGIRISGGGLGPNGFTRAPERDAFAFAPGTIPNRDPHTTVPAPMDHPHRANACVWTEPGQIDYFIASMQELVSRMPS